MTDVTPQKFLEILQDPTMSAMKDRLIEIINNPDTSVLDVTTQAYHPTETTLVIRLRI